MTGIELVGAPGSGKSTLARWLAGRAVRDARGRCVLRVVPAELLLRTPRRSLRALDEASHRELLALCARHPRLGALLLDGPSSVELGRDDGPGHGAGSEGWEEVRRAVLAAPVDGPRGDPAYRSSAADWLDVTARLAEVARAAPIGVVPLLHEGLLQRGLSVLGHSGSSTARALLFGMLPDGVLVVHLAATDDLLVARAMGRLDAGREPDLHRGMERDDVARLVLDDSVALARSVDHVAESGVRVLRLEVAEEGHVRSPASLGAQVLSALAEGFSAA